MYFKKANKIFLGKMLIVCLIASIFCMSCSLLEKEEVSFQTEEVKDEKKNTSNEEETKTAKSQEKESNIQESVNSTQQENIVLYVYICGQVKNPGVYSLEAGKRVNDAVNLAGGFTKEADTTSLNLARQIVDGEQIYVMSKEEAATNQTTAVQATNSGESTSGGEMFSTSDMAETKPKVNINTASREELMSLSGIGQAKADSIIAYRQTNGPFQSIEEIKQIEGIKDGIFLKIKDQITT